MEFFQGQPGRPGVAIARRRPPSQRVWGAQHSTRSALRRLGERLRRFGIEAPEPEQVVLVAESLPRRLSRRPPCRGSNSLESRLGWCWANAAMLPCPCVTGLPDTMFVALEEDEIVIVDGDRGGVCMSHPTRPHLPAIRRRTRRAHRVFIGKCSPSCAHDLGQPPRHRDRAYPGLLGRPGPRSRTGRTVFGSPADNSFLGH